MSAEIRKELFWGSVIELFVFAPCWMVLLDQRGYKDVFPAAVDAIVYGKEDPVGRNPSAYEQLMIYDLLDPPEDEEEAEVVTEEMLEKDMDTLPYSAIMAICVISLKMRRGSCDNSSISTKS